MVGLGAAALFLSFPSRKGPGSGEQAPPFALADLSGRTVTLSAYRGKVVLLDFWATWCHSCLAELPALKELHSRLAPRGLELLAASLDEDGPRVVAEFAAKHRLPWTVLFGDGDTARAYGVWGLPTKYVIDAQGVIRRKYLGEADLREIEKDILALIEGVKTKEAS